MTSAPAKKAEGLVDPKTTVLEETGPVPRDTPLKKEAKVFLHYKGGRASHRQITSTEFAEAGIKHPTVVFGPMNGLSIAIGEDGGISEEASDRLLLEVDDYGVAEFEKVDSKGDVVDREDSKS